MNFKSSKGQNACEFDTNSNSQVDVLNESFNNSITSSSNPSKKSASLYIICEKSQIKSLKSSELSKGGDTSHISFIPVDVHEVRDTKNSFRNLCKACVPSTAQHEITNDLGNTGATSNAFTSSSNLSGQTTNENNSTGFNGKSKSNNFRRSSHKKLNRINQFNTNINVNHSLTTHSHASQSAVNSVSTVGFHKQINDSKWFEQLQVNFNFF